MTNTLDAATLAAEEINGWAAFDYTIASANERELVVVAYNDNPSATLGRSAPGNAQSATLNDRGDANALLV